MISKQELEKFFETWEFGKCAPFDRHEVLSTFMLLQLCNEISKLTEAVNGLKELNSIPEPTKGRKPKTKEE
jgi:hypothetical protein